MTDDAIESRLRSNPFFAGLEPEDLPRLASRATWRTVPANGIVFEHGDRAGSFFLLCEGAIVIEVPAISGPSLEVQRLGPGDVLGWSWLIPPYRWSFQARAEGETALIEFDGEAVREECERDPVFGYRVLKRFSSLMSERLEAARLKMMEEWNPPGFA
ncbi:Crp/Fnr family transcriptional regulator [Spiribacter halobius]|uniref:Regulator n=1 Tax=Sediminicurvatus halobius TaxID=2182432 RepID=A0A2U2MXZ5_9GAMM|nr:cyclic nucleotide-binding domain-containing protein [Spiribacter halobius]PWG61895.1 regulator [Spiribacter halobius]UEX79230.1 cyclic nucleotide-binding domain-containing protein [Spiribacter halobius]